MAPTDVATKSEYRALSNLADSLFSPLVAMIPTFSPVPIRVPIVSKISVNEKARMAIKVSGKREVFEIKDPNPSEPRAAPNKVPRSLTADERLLLAKSMLDKSTRPTAIARTVVVKIERMIPPLIPLTTKKIVMARPARATKTAGVLKSTNPGTAAEFAVSAA